MYEEQVLTEKVQLETLALPESGQEAYLSFNRTFLSDQWSTWKKWHFVEGLARTLYYACPAVNTLFFQVNHQIMIDEHLDFSLGWPTGGFEEQ